MPKIGETIPEFTLDAYFQGEIKKISLAKFRGNWLVLLFYPGDFSFVCPTELEEAAENEGEFKKLNAQIISISTDSAYVHKAWHDQSPSVSKVQYPMLSDPTGIVCKSFDTYQDSLGESIRSTYIVDPDQKVIAYEMHADSIGRNTQEILRKLQAAVYVKQHGATVVCPASWTPGKKTLTKDIKLVGKI
jgi:NADH-dependent peroxiredoxin subunit C